MEHSNVHNAFVKALEFKIPKKTKLADFIAENLFIEKETAYRRLRGEVQFSLREAGILAGKLGISLDELILKEASPLNDTILLQLPHQPLKGENTFLQTQEALTYLEKLTNDNHSELGVALSGFTFSLYLQYSLLYRFFIMKYMNHAENIQTTTPFEKTEAIDLSSELRQQFYLLFRGITNTYYIWDRQIIRLFINDIKYAQSIRLMTNEEVFELKQELHRFLNDLEHLAAKGKFEETGNIFELYISEAHIDVTYAYMHSDTTFVSMLSSFVLYATASQEKALFTNISNWIKSLKRHSTLVSGIGERERILFFDEQRLIVNTL